MPIKRPDIYEHNNPDNAIADSNFVRGGFRTSVSGISDLYSLSTKSDQLKPRSTIVYVTNASGYYVLVDSNNIGNASGWQQFSTGGSVSSSGSWNVSNGIVSSGVNSGDTVNFIGVSGVTTTLEQQTLFINANSLPNSRKSTINVSGNITLNINSDFVFVDCSTSSVQITLPTAVNNSGKQIFVKRKTGLNTLRIIPDGAETIDGKSFVDFYYNYEAFSLVSDNVSWFIF